MFSNLFAYQFALERNDAQMLDRMLKSRPVGFNLNITYQWSRLKPFTVEFVQPFWDKLNGSQPLLDMDATHYEEWDVK